jgi:oxygen-independent coproporphyrinogen-3 oxidase
MPKGAIATIISELKEKTNIIENAEISIEVNPNAIDYMKAVEYKNCGINRISIGLQTTKKNCLNAIGRTHTLDDYVKCVNLLKDCGFENINTDLMIGLPIQRLSDVKRSLGLVLKFGVTHISVYSLILEEGTPLFDLIESRKLKLPKEEKVLSMYNYAKMFLEEQNFKRYEVSNFALPGFECKHNLNTWDMKEYIGFGAGAHSFYDNTRYSNIESLEEYMQNINNEKIPVETRETLGEKELLEETIMLGLRKTEGIDLNQIKTKFKVAKTNQNTTYFNSLFVNIVIQMHWITRINQRYKNVLLLILSKLFL